MLLHVIQNTEEQQLLTGQRGSASSERIRPFPYLAHMLRLRPIPQDRLPGQQGILIGTP
jgi:hypothetical protein